MWSRVVRPRAMMQVSGPFSHSLLGSYFLLFFIHHWTVPRSPCMLRNSLAISTIVEVKVLLDQIHLGLNLQKRIGVNGRPASRTHLVKTRLFSSDCLREAHWCQATITTSTTGTRKAASSSSLSTTQTLKTRLVERPPSTKSLKRILPSSLWSFLHSRIIKTASG